MSATTTVQELLEAKHDKIHCVGPDDTVFEALKVMSDVKIGALLVLEEGKLVGMFSERDYARKVILEGKASKDTKVKEVMTKDVCHVALGQNVKECMALMNKNRFRHLPVVDGGEVVGLVSIGDIVRAILMSLLET